MKASCECDGAMAQQPNRPLRALAPRIVLIPENVASGLATEEVKTKRASTACQECKRRRTRCSTGAPCSECAAHGRECIYDELADKRRKVAAKHTLEELEYYRGFLERLLESIRYGEPANIDTIIGVIRGGACQEEILVIVNQSLGLTKRVEEKEKNDIEDMEDRNEVIMRLEDSPLSPSASYGTFHPFEDGHE